MAIAFVDGADLKTEAIVAVFYGQPNIGKSSLALTAADPLMLDFDRGAHRAGNKAGKQIVRVKAWADVNGMDQDDLEPFKTIVIDTVGTALDRLAKDIIASEPKYGRQGSLTLQGYGVLKSRFKTWLDNMRDYGKDVILIAHASEEQRGDEQFVDRIVAAGGSKQEIYQQADIMGSLKPRRDGKRILSFDLSVTSFGKNVGLPEYEVKDPALNPTLAAEIVQRAKVLINDKVDAQAEENRRLNQLREHLQSQEKDPAVFNDILQKMIEGNAAPADRHMLIQVAERDKGLIFDKKAKTFSAPAPKDEKPADGAGANPF